MPNFSFRSAKVTEKLLYCKQDNVHTTTESVQCIPIVNSIWPYKYRVVQKMSLTFACVIQPNGQSESTQKHLCNDRTSTNMCRNFCLKHFCISCDTNKIVLHVMQQFLQAVHHLRFRSYAGYAKTSQLAESSVTDQQKKCWISPLFSFATDAKCFFPLLYGFSDSGCLMSTSCHLSVITF